MSATVLRLGCTPLKGTRHADQDRVRVECGGVVGDRVFALLDPLRCRVLRTVENPALLAIRTAWDGESLRVELPDGRSVSGPSVDAGAAVPADYWGRTEQLVHQDGEHGALISACLGVEVRVARAAPGAVVYGGPVSIVTTGEIAELEERLGGEVDARAFRATMTLDLDRRLVAGERLSVGGVRLEVAGGIDRCAVIDLDPVTGQQTAPVLRTLAGYRRAQGGVLFGADARVLAPGDIRVGDRADLEGR